MDKSIGFKLVEHGGHISFGQKTQIQNFVSEFTPHLVNFSHISIKFQLDSNILASP